MDWRLQNTENPILRINLYLYINITLHFFSHIHKLALSHYFSLCLVNVRLQKYYHLSSIGYAQHKQHVRQNSLCRIFYVFIFDHIFTALHPLIFCIKLVPAPTKCCRIVTLLKNIASVFLKNLKIIILQNKLQFKIL